MITTRYGQAKFPTLPGYVDSHPHVHLIYLDANNLYGWAMSQPLPTGGFRFLQPDEIEALTPVHFFLRKWLVATLMIGSNT